MTAHVAAMSGFMLRTSIRRSTGCPAFKATPQVAAFAPRTRRAFAARAGVGDPVPDITLYENTPDGKVNLKELFGSGKGVILGLPGAFTPECSSNHLPGFLGKLDDLKKAGAEVVVCTAVNDPFVLKAWGDDQNVTGKIRMLADTHSELTTALDLEMDTSAILGNNRMKRWSAVIKDGKFASFNVEPDGGGSRTSISSSGNTLEQLQSL